MKFLVILFLVWRTGLFIASWLGEKILLFSPRFPYSDAILIPSGLPSWLWSFANFDGVHYLNIAVNGYSAQFTQVFFPVYPYLIGVLHKLISVNPIVLGLVISNLFFLLGLILFSELLALDYKLGTIKWILLFLIIFPTSFFFGSIYTESLFFFLLVASFYAARKRKWVLAGLLGGLASGTRLIGIFLLPALLYEWTKEFRIQNSEFIIQTKKSISPKFYRKILHSTFTILHSPILYLVPLGLIYYMIYLQINFGDLLYFWHAQPVFGAERSGGSVILLPQVLWRYLKIFTTLPILSEQFWISLGEFISTIGSLILLYIAYSKKVRPSYIVFSLFAVIIPTLTGTFSSMSRYILIGFPIFITLGKIKSIRLKFALILIFCTLLILFTMLFTRGHWVA